MPSGWPPGARSLMAAGRSADYSPPGDPPGPWWQRPQAQRTDRPTGPLVRRQVGMTVVAIDGPYHGDRVGAPLTQAEVQARIAADGPAEVVDRMTGDWLATIAAIEGLGWADTSVLGYLGLSMGSRYGIPLAAALGDRLRAAVFGKFGLRQTPPVPAAVDMFGLIELAARRVSARALLHMQWDDELFPRDGQLLLFEHLGSSDKRLVAYPGRHADRHPEAVETWQDFLVRNLKEAAVATASR